MLSRVFQNSFKYARGFSVTSKEGPVLILRTTVEASKLYGYKFPEFKPGCIGDFEKEVVAAEKMQVRTEVRIYNDDGGTLGPSDMPSYSDDGGVLGGKIEKSPETMGSGTAFED